MLGFADSRPLNLVIPLKQARAIAKHLDITTCGELLQYYPRRYLQYGKGADLTGMEEGSTATIIGTVVSTTLIPNRKTPKRPIFRIEVDDGRQTIPATFFGSAYAQRMLRELSLIHI